MLKGALAAAVTPLVCGGETLDEDAFDPLVGFLESGGLDGLLALGTTGEGILLSAAERRRAAELFIAARPEGFAVAVHCGAQTTRETEELAAHAADLGADAVAVIGPPCGACRARISRRCARGWSSSPSTPRQSMSCGGAASRSARRCGVRCGR